jgi:hypothetical protein
MIFLTKDYVPDADRADLMIGWGIIDQHGNVSPIVAAAANRFMLDRGDCSPPAIIQAPAAPPAVGGASQGQQGSGVPPNQPVERDILYITLIHGNMYRISF